MSWNVLRKRLAYLFIPVIVVLNIREASIAGIAIILAGVLIRLWASGYLTKKTSLVTSGPYAFLRNPLYLGSLTIGLGFCVMVRNIWLGAGIVIFFAVVYYKQMVHEERELARLYGEKYSMYYKHVPRLFPRIMPYKMAGGGRFDLKNIIRNREYNVILGVAGIFALMHIYNALRRMF